MFPTCNSYENTSDFFSFKENSNFHRYIFKLCFRCLLPVESIAMFCKKDAAWLEQQVVKGSLLSLIIHFGGVSLKYSTAYTT